MSMSLRDQLLKAGLVSEQQAKEAERQASQQQRHKHKQQPKDKRAAPTETQRAAHQAQTAKTARDQELSRRQKEQAEHKARQAQIDQLIEQHRMARAETDERYNFVVNGKIRRMPADAALRARIIRGEVVIVRGSAGYALVPAEAAARIAERSARAVISVAAEAAQSAAPATEDAYAGFEVPDDLMW
jgi:hypothetical protein